MPKMAERVTRNESKPSVLEDFSQKLRDAEGRTPSHDPVTKESGRRKSSWKIKDGKYSSDFSKREEVCFTGSIREAQPWCRVRT